MTQRERTLNKILRKFTLDYTVASLEVYDDDPDDIKEANPNMAENHPEILQHIAGNLADVIGRGVAGVFGMILNKVENDILGELASREGTEVDDEALMAEINAANREED